MGILLLPRGSVLANLAGFEYLAAVHVSSANLLFLPDMTRHRILEPCYGFILFAHLPVVICLCLLCLVLCDVVFIKPGV